MLFYGCASVVVFSLFLLVHERYLSGCAAALLDIGQEEAGTLLDSVLMNLTSGRYMSFNIFIDLFLFTLLAFFLLYDPKKVFVGKKRLIFRCFAVFPILYELFSFFLKALIVSGLMEVRSFVFPLLTTKPPMTFIVFLILAFYLKARERIYRKKGGTHEQYQEYLKTNANSLRFSSFTAWLFVIAGIIDFIIQLFLTFVLAGALMSLSGPEESTQLFESSFFTALDVMFKCGVGGSSFLILIAPILLLFSYTRTHKEKRIDMAIPAVAVGCLGLVYIEGLYRFIVGAGQRLEEILSSFL